MNCVHVLESSNSMDVAKGGKYPLPLGQRLTKLGKVNASNQPTLQVENVHVFYCPLYCSCALDPSGGSAARPLLEVRDTALAMAPLPSDSMSMSRNLAKSETCEILLRYSINPIRVFSRGPCGVLCFWERRFSLNIILFTV